MICHILHHFQSDAQQLEMAKITKHGGGIGAPTKEERMKEAANLHIKTGNIQRYCELMVELGQVTLCSKTSIAFTKS